MGKLIERILGLLSPLIIFSSNVEGKNTPDVRTINNIDSLDKIELISKPPPLILKQADFINDDIFAGHRSHSSHSSHASHRSHASHASGSYSPSTPSESPTSTKPLDPTTPIKSPTPRPTYPLTSEKEWSSSTEWKKEPCKLYQKEVIVATKGNDIILGVVSNCDTKTNNLEITVSGSKRKQLIKSGEIVSLMWR